MYIITGKAYGTISKKDGKMSLRALIVDGGDSRVAFPTYAKAERWALTLSSAYPSVEYTITLIETDGRGLTVATISGSKVTL